MSRFLLRGRNSYLAATVHLEEMSRHFDLAPDIVKMSGTRWWRCRADIEPVGARRTGRRGLIALDCGPAVDGDARVTGQRAGGPAEQRAAAPAHARARRPAAIATTAWFAARSSTRTARSSTSRRRVPSTAATSASASRHSARSLRRSTPTVRPRCGPIIPRAMPASTSAPAPGRRSRGGLIR